MIRSIEDEIIIATMIGKAKSGKSYLMNLIIQDDPKGFKVSSSSSNERNSKGVYIWGNYKQKDNSKAKILFIDTELSCSRDSYTDPKLFTLLYLISSILIYNSSSFIDENAFSEFSVLPEIPNTLSTNVNLF
jgi:hypothetical protein